MKIKRYIANTTQEAMYKLKRELGPDTVILHTRKIKKPGMFGFLKKPLVEVVAALDENDISKNKNKFIKENVNKTNSNKDTHSHITQNRVNKINSDDNVMDEIKSLKSTIETLAKNMNTENESSNLLPEKLSYYYDYLQEIGVEPNIAYDILKGINTRFNISEKDKSTINEILKLEIKEILGRVEPINLNNEQKIVFFVGPTGVGKTTTLAKIAANYVVNNNKKVGLITTDTYRIAAVEQLKTYSEILDLSLKTVYDIKEMYSALSNLKDKDIILIDTAGRNMRDNKMKSDLIELMDVVNNKEIFLVLSATTNLNIIKTIIDQYSFINNYRIIVTKIDESDNYSTLLNIKYYTKNSLSYLTNGQSVPEDIEKVNINKITNILTKELDNE